MQQEKLQGKGYWILPFLLPIFQNFKIYFEENSEMLYSTP
jgi:hypothetical protein